MAVKILYICFSKAWGGLEKYAVTLALENMRRGHEVLFACRRGYTVEKELKKSGVPLRAFGYVKYIDIPLMLRLRKIIREEGIEIVHAHLSEELGVVVPAVWGMDNVSLFFSLHMVVPGPKKDIYHRLQYSRIRKIFALGHEGECSACRNLPVPPDRVMELPYGMDVGKYGTSRPEGIRKSLGVGDDEIVIGILSRLDPLKGQMEAVRAMPYILERHRNARLLLVGEETEHLRGKVKRLIEEEIAKLGLEGKVTMLGYRSDVEDVICAMDIFLLPSHYESYSISVIEAKLCGVPIVATNTGGVPQNLGYGEYGILVEPKNPKALAQGVLDVLENMDAAKERASNARRNALERYDKERILDILETEYRKGVAGAPVR